jgi:hypothetical protein
MDPILPTTPSSPPPARAAVTLGSLLSSTFATWRANFAAFATVSLLFQGAILAASVALGSPFVAQRARFGQANAAQVEFARSGRYKLLVTLTSVLAILEMGALCVGALAHLSGRRATVGEMVGGALRRAGPLLVTNLLAFLAMAGGLVLLVVPGLIVGMMLFLVDAVVVAEPLPIKSVFGRSRALTKGHRWRLVGLLFVTYLVVLAPTLVIGQLPVDLPYVSTALGMIAGAVVGPILQATPAVAYHALRRLREGDGTAALERVFE